MSAHIAIDSMGGDHGLSVTVPAALKFLERHPDFAILLVGQTLWGLMAMMNVKLTPAIPWSALVMPFVLAVLVAWLNNGAGLWPATVRFAPGTDGALITRRLRMAAAWAGPVTPGAYQSGDGRAGLTVELAGEHAPVSLSLLINPATGELRQADVAL